MSSELKELLADAARLLLEAADLAHREKHPRRQEINGAYDLVYDLERKIK